MLLTTEGDTPVSIMDKTALKFLADLTLPGPCSLLDKYS